MGKTNGKSEMKSRDLDIEHELPAAEEGPYRPDRECLPRKRKSANYKS